MDDTIRSPRQFLGVGLDTDPAEVELQYQELQSFLDLRKVPRSLRPWAIRQRALVDEAYAAAVSECDDLSESSEEPAANAAEPDDGEDGEEEDEPEPDLPDDLPPPSALYTKPSHPEPCVPVLPSALAHPPKLTTNGVATKDGPPRDGRFEVITEDRRSRSSSAALPSPSRVSPQSGASRARRGPSAPERRPNGRPSANRPQLEAKGRTAQSRQGRGSPRLPQSWKRLALGIVLGLAVLGGIYVASKGLPSVGFGVAQASSGSASQQQAQVDTKRVAELTAVVAKDPANKDALFELGETYIQAGRWQESLDWFTKLLAVDPENLHARTDVGTDSYNLGRPDAARTAWEEVARRNPGDPQIHYNLGYLYANSFGTVGDVQAATKEWQRVIELAPGTELAKAAQSGLDLLGKQ